MAVYVDQLRQYPEKVKGYDKWCHLVADSLSELMAFSCRIGLRSTWLQTNNYPRFDLTEGKRVQALKMGATEINDETLVKIIRSKNDKP